MFVCPAFTGNIGYTELRPRQSQAFKTCGGLFLLHFVNDFDCHSVVSVSMVPDILHCDL